MDLHDLHVWVSLCVEQMAMERLSAREHHLSDPESGRDMARAAMVDEALVRHCAVECSL